MIDFELYSMGGSNYDYVQKAFIKLKVVLDSFKTSQNHPIKVFLQGSYKNDTNIGRESDIDIVVYYENVFESNIENPQHMNQINYPNTISPADILRYKNAFSTSIYSGNKYKQEVLQYLKKHTSYIITEGRKTIKCQIPNSRFVFDIICAIQYRLYKNFNNINSSFIPGNLIYDQSNNQIINFPKQSYINSVSKNKNCEGKYKETVRIFKNIMVKKIDESFWIPSFALESLLYNVPNNFFLSNSKSIRFNQVLGQINQLVRNKWNYLTESNELLYVKNIGGAGQEKCLNLDNKFINLK